MLKLDTQYKYPPHTMEQSVPVLPAGALRRPCDTVCSRDRMDSPAPLLRLWLNDPGTRYGFRSPSVSVAAVQAPDTYAAMTRLSTFSLTASGRVTTDDVFHCILVRAQSSLTAGGGGACCSTPIALRHGQAKPPPRMSPTSYRNYWRDVPDAKREFIKNFTPQLFTLCMGTGVLGVLMRNNAYQFKGMGERFEPRPRRPA